MIKKRAFVFLILTILAASFVFAQSNDTTIQSGVSDTDFLNKAYQCLTSQVDKKSPSEISLHEAIFASLALGSNSKLTSVIESKAITGNHWAQSTGDDIKDTARVLLTYKRIGRTTSSIEDWLSTKSIPASDLIWYLQIDIPNRIQSSCKINTNEEKTITINEDMTLSGNPGACFSISSSGFWLRVNNNCIDKNISVSCDQDFVTNLLYQRTSASTIFVSPATHSASALGTTKESINSKCLSTTNACNYEGTLWAALALDNAGKDVSAYLPYLLALSEANLKYLPSAFLHKITQGSDQYSALVQSQQQGKYWQAPTTTYNRYYDSALAMLSLQSTSAVELTNSQEYFKSITTPEGCWNNNDLRDTGFLLYAGWPRSASPPSGGGSSDTCASKGYSCISSLFACTELNGTVLDFDCPSSGICCSESPQVQSCSAQNGKLCLSTQSCSGTEVPSTDGSCCLATCEDLPAANVCEQAGGSCYSSCQDNEEQTSDACDDTSEVCCIPKSSTDSGGSSLWVWIIILIILIALVVLGIIYRHKLRLMLFKSRSKNQGAPYPGTFPPRGPPPAMRSIPPGMMRRPMPTMQQQPPPRRPAQSMSREDKEMEDTIKKLKDMSG